MSNQNFNANQDLNEQVLDQQLKLWAKVIASYQLTLPIILFLDSVYPLRKMSHFLTEFFAPFGETFFSKTYLTFQKLLADEQQYQAFLKELENQQHSLESKEC